MNYTIDDLPYAQGDIGPYPVSAPFNKCMNMLRPGPPEAVIETECEEGHYGVVVLCMDCFNMMTRGGPYAVSCDHCGDGSVQETVAITRWSPAHPQLTRLHPR